MSYTLVPILTEPLRPPRKSDYFKPGTTLTEPEQRYCRCVIHVEKSDSAKNPIAICRASTHAYSRNCGENYNFSAFPDTELKAYAQVHKISIPEPYNRDQLLRNIAIWKQTES
jgi:hypothetical protein